MKAEIVEKMYHEFGDTRREEIILDADIEYRIRMERESFEVFRDLVGKISRFLKVFSTLYCRGPLGHHRPDSSMAC